MNELTLGLGAAAITLLILRKKRQQRRHSPGNYGTAPAPSADYAQPAYTSAPATVSTSAPRSGGSSSSSSASRSISRELGNRIQALLRNYNAAYSREMGRQRFANDGLSDGIVGSRTSAAWGLLATDMRSLGGRGPEARHTRALEEIPVSDLPEAIAALETWMSFPWVFAALRGDTGSTSKSK